MSLTNILPEIITFVAGGGIVSLITIPITRRKERAISEQEVEKSRKAHFESEQTKINLLNENVRSYSELVKNLDQKCIELIERCKEAENKIVEAEARAAKWEKKYQDLFEKYSDLKKKFDELSKKI